MQQKDTMADYDIPIAMAAPAAGDVSVAAAGTLLTKGRSKRVVVPNNHEPKILADHELKALKDQGFTSGLIKSIQRNNVSFPLRIWVVDNSGSMSMGDGHRIVSTSNNNNVKLVGCSRWTEIRDTVDYHVQMAALLQAPTVFRLLYDPGKLAGPQQFSIGERGSECIFEDLGIAQSTMAAAQPSGVTPLSLHVNEIRANILAMHQELVEAGTKVVIVLATDGLPTDEKGYSSEHSRIEFQNALRSLEGLPVWIVVRLCTDEDSVVEYYNNLDAQLELSLEVLDDFIGESAEVNEHNKWLNYALPLHRIREMGFNHRLFDLLDERKLTMDELRDFMFLLFGEDNFDGVPDPQLDFKGFLNSIESIVRKEKNQWNPVTRKMGPWIDIKKLKKAYQSGGCSIM
jgi:hypothetical protein